MAVGRPRSVQHSLMDCVDPERVLRAQAFLLHRRALFTIPSAFARAVAADIQVEDHVKKEPEDLLFIGLDRKHNQNYM
jgi:hypothetical protein